MTATGKSCQMSERIKNHDERRGFLSERFQGIIFKEIFIIFCGIINHNWYNLIRFRLKD